MSAAPAAAAAPHRRGLRAWARGLGHRASRPVVDSTAFLGAVTLAVLRVR